MSLNIKSIGNKITEARKKTNLSQADLAKQVSISPQAVGKWERGESMPDITTLNRLAEILGVDLNYFSENFPSANSEFKPNKPFTNQLDETSVENNKKKHSWDMSQQHLVDIDFSGLKNLHEKFSFSHMQRCLFIDADLTKLSLKGNNIDSCDFRGSNFSNSQFQNSHLLNNAFNDCLFEETEFSGSYLQGCNLSGADFTDAKFRSSHITKSNLKSVVWDKTSFQKTGFEDVVFEGIIEGCVFEGCSFDKVKFQGAILINTFFKNNMRLKKIEFLDCKADSITYAFLKSNSANLSGITLITV